MQMHFIDWKIYTEEGADAWRTFNLDRLARVPPDVANEVKMLTMIDDYIRGGTTNLPWGPCLGMKGIPQTGGLHPANSTVDKMRTFPHGGRWRHPIYHWDNDMAAAAPGQDHVCFTSRINYVLAGGGVAEAHYFKWGAPEKSDPDERLLAALALLVHFQPQEAIVTTHYVRTLDETKRIRIPYEQFGILADLWRTRRLELIHATA